jgi:hypothetical protein
LAADRATEHRPEDCHGKEALVLTETRVKVEGGVVIEEITESVTFEVTCENSAPGGFSVPGPSDPDTGTKG